MLEPGGSGRACEAKNRQVCRGQSFITLALRPKLDGFGLRSAESKGFLPPALRAGLALTGTRLFEAQ